MSELNRFKCADCGIVWAQEDGTCATCGADTTPVYVPPAALREARLACEDCGLPYADFQLDLTIPDAQWKTIHPERDGGGVLCANCIVERASKLPGVIAVRAVIERIEPAQPTPPAGEPRKVGCEREDGLLNIHPESETCEVCRPPAGEIEAWANRIANEEIWNRYEEHAYRKAMHALQMARDAFERLSTPSPTREAHPPVDIEELCDLAAAWESMADTPVAAGAVANVLRTCASQVRRALAKAQGERR